ncbi:MAG: MarR family transcriptional regulator [Oscillospiraceae bacterium]|nr:MarR family transcriptional regulator [Oscillospiraceae bacterium]
MKNSYEKVVKNLKTFDEQLNFVLTQSYGLISNIEQSTLMKSKRFKLSLNELKLLYVVSCHSDGLTMTQLAEHLFITPSSVTIAVKCLEKKGYCLRERAKDDARRVFIRLTKEGEHAARIHRRFHRNFANVISKDLTEVEKAALIKCINNMNQFVIERWR